MADPRLAYSREEIEAAWRDPEFHREPEDLRLQIMSNMDPLFSQMSAMQKRKVLYGMAQKFGKPVTPPPQAPEEMAAGLLAESGLPPSAPGVARAQLEEVPAGVTDVYNPFQRLRQPKPQQPPAAMSPAAPAPAAPPLATPATPPPSSFGVQQMPALPASKPTGSVLELSRRGPYATTLQPSEEKEFQNWVRTNNVPFDPGPQSTYDMRGYWRALRNRDQRAAAGDPTNPPAEWMTPFHPDFSNKSIFAGKDAPKWMGEKLVDAFGQPIRDKAAERAGQKAMAQQQKQAEKLASKSLDQVFQRTPLAAASAGGAPPVDTPLAEPIMGAGPMGVPGAPAPPPPNMMPSWEEGRQMPVAQPGAWPMVAETPPAEMFQYPGWENDPGIALGSSTARAAINTGMQAPGGVLQMAGNAIGSDFMRNTGEQMESIGNVFDESLAAPPVRGFDQDGAQVFANPRWWANTIGNGIGSMAPLMASGMGAGAVIEKALQLGLIRGRLAEIIIQYGPSAVSGLSEGILAGGSAYLEAKQSGKSEAEAQKAFAIVAAATAATAIPAYKAGVFNDSLTGAKKILSSGGTETLQETGQGVFENIAADRPLEAGQVENAVGGFFGGVGGAMMDGRPVERDSQPQRPPAAPPPADLPPQPQAAPPTAEQQPPPPPPPAPQEGQRQAVPFSEEAEQRAESYLLSYLNSDTPSGTNIALRQMADFVRENGVENLSEETRRSLLDYTSSVQDRTPPSPPQQPTPTPASPPTPAAEAAPQAPPPPPKRKNPMRPPAPPPVDIEEIPADIEQMLDEREQEQPPAPAPQQPQNAQQQEIQSQSEQPQDQQVTPQNQPQQKPDENKAAEQQGRRVRVTIMPGTRMQEIREGTVYQVSQGVNGEPVYDVDFGDGPQRVTSRDKVQFLDESPSPAPEPVSQPDELPAPAQGNTPTNADLDEDRYARARQILRDEGQISRQRLRRARGFSPQAAARILDRMRQEGLIEAGDYGLPVKATAKGLAPAEEPRKFSSTQVNLPPDVSDGVRSLASRIPDADLAEDGRETEPHITVKYGLHGNDAEEVRKVLAGEPPVRVKLGKVSLFENEDADVVKIEVDSPDLHRLNKKIAEAVEVTDTHPDYKPHVTIAYVKPGMGKKYVDSLNDLQGKEITLNSLTFSGKDRTTTEIPLSGAAPQPVSNPDELPAGEPSGNSGELAGAAPANVSDSTQSTVAPNPEPKVSQAAPESEPPAPASTPTTDPKSDASREETFNRLYSETVSKSNEEYEKEYPATQALRDAETLQKTGRVEIPSRRYPGKVAAVVTKTRTEGRGRSKKTISFYEVETDEGRTWTYEIQPGQNDDWAIGNALARATNGNSNKIALAIRNGGSYVSWNDRMNAADAALKAAYPEIENLPALSTGVASRLPVNPTLADAKEALAQSLPGNLQDVDNQWDKDKRARRLDLYESEANKVAQIVGDEHYRVKNVRKMIEEFREADKKKAEMQAEIDRARAEREARDKAEAEEKQARFDAKFNAYKPIDLAPMKLTSAEETLFREADLGTEESRLSTFPNNGQIQKLNALGLIVPNSMVLTPEGERVALQVRRDDEALLAGKPIAEYEPKNKKIEPLGGSKTFATGPIPVGGDIWHTNAHMAALGPPPKYWPAPVGTGNLPNLQAVLPKEKATVIWPAAFSKLKDGMIAVHFNDGTVLNSLYFDYINKLHEPDEWAAKDSKSAVAAYKDGKLVAVTMPLRDVGEKESLKAILAEANKSGPPKPEPKPFKKISSRRRKEQAGFMRPDLLTAPLDALARRMRRGPREVGPQGDYFKLTGDVEDRFQGAGKPQEEVKSAIDKLKEFGESWDGIWRVYRRLPREKYGRLIFEMKKLEKAKGITSGQVLIDMTKAIGDLTLEQYELFRKAVIVDDLMETVDIFEEQGESIPDELAFGYTPDVLREDHRRAMDAVATDPAVRSAMDARRAIWANIKREYMDAMRAIGEDMSDKMKRQSYYRHRVLLAKRLDRLAEAGGGSVQTPNRRSFLKRRGAENVGKDYATDFISTEMGVMTQLMIDTRTARFVKFLDDELNIIKDLKKQAKAANIRAVMPYFADLARQWNADLPPSADFEYTENDAFRQVLNTDQAIALNKLGKLAANGALPDTPDGKYREVIENLATAYLERRSAEEEFEGPPASMDVEGDLFGYLSWVMRREGQDEASKRAGQFFKGVREKQKAIQRIAGDQFVTWEDIIPEGYAKKKIDPTRAYYSVFGIPEQLAMQLMEDQAEEIGVKKEDLRKVFAMGAEREPMILPEEVVKQFEEMEADINSRRVKQHVLVDAARSTMAAYKRYLLLAPQRMTKYMLRNQSGDMDSMMAGLPTWATTSKAGLKELIWQHQKDVKDYFLPILKGDLKSVQMTPALREFAEFGAFEGLLASVELGDNIMPQVLEEFTRWEKKLPPKTFREKYGPGALWGKYMRGAEVVNNWREAANRYAVYQIFLKDIRKNGGNPSTYSASIKEEVDALETPEEKAYRMSNDLMGAYDEVSVAGQALRTYAIPFWSYQELNFKRYFRLFANGVREGATDEKFLGMNIRGVARAPYMAYKMGGTATKIMAMWALWAAMNALFSDDDDKELRKEIRQRPHLTFGKVNGETIYFPRIGNINDILEWVDLEESVDNVRSAWEGRKPWHGAVFDIVRGGPGEKLFLSVGHHIKYLIEGPTGKTYYPNVDRPRSIESWPEKLAQDFGFGDFFRYATGRPRRQESWGNKAADLAIYRSDPGESAYYDILELQRSWLRKQGEADNDFTSNKPTTTALRNIKKALRYGDQAAFNKYLTQYVELGGTPKGYQDSVRFMHPLNAIRNADKRAAFLESLNEEDRRRLDMAMDYYEDTFKGDKAEKYMREFEEGKQK